MTGGDSAQPLALRPLAKADIDPLTDLWCEAWHDAHAAVVPEALTRLRTRESFCERLLSAPELCHLSGPESAPTGLIRLKGDEIDQFYVAPSMRGTGLASA